MWWNNIHKRHSQFFLCMGFYGGPRQSLQHAFHCTSDTCSLQCMSVWRLHTITKLIYWQVSNCNLCMCTCKCHLMQLVPHPRKRCVPVVCMSDNCLIMSWWGTCDLHKTECNKYNWVHFLHFLTVMITRLCLKPMSDGRDKKSADKTCHTSTVAALKTWRDPWIWRRRRRRCGFSCFVNCIEEKETTMTLKHLMRSSHRG